MTLVPVTPRRTALLVLVALLLAAAAATAAATMTTPAPADARQTPGTTPAPAGARQTPGTTVADARDDSGGVIPRPNSGHPPTASGDRGGWAQLTLFGIVTAGLAFIAATIVRTSRRARRARTPPH